MGVCCIVFDIDEMLFEFVMNFLNIEKKKIFFCSSIFHVFITFHAISNIKKKIGVKKHSGGRGFSFHVLCYFQHYFFFIETPHLSVRPSVRPSEKRPLN